MTNNEMNELDNQSIIISLATISNSITLSNPENNIFSIISSDNTINYTLNLSNPSESLFDSVVELLTYSYNERNLVMNEIHDEYDLLDNLYKFFNAIILTIDNELELIQNSHLLNSDNTTPKTRQEILYNMQVINTYSANIDNIDSDSYKTLVVSKMIVDSICSSSVFFSGYELLDYIKVVREMALIIPFYQDQNLIQLLNDLLSTEQSIEDN